MKDDVQLAITIEVTGQQLSGTPDLLVADLRDDAGEEPTRSIPRVDPNLRHGALIVECGHEIRGAVPVEISAHEQVFRDLIRSFEGKAIVLQEGAVLLALKQNGLWRPCELLQRKIILPVAVEIAHRPRSRIVRKPEFCRDSVRGAEEDRYAISPDASVANHNIVHPVAVEVRDLQTSGRLTAGSAPLLEKRAIAETQEHGDIHGGEVGRHQISVTVVVDIRGDDTEGLVADGELAMFDGPTERAGPVAQEDTVLEGDIRVSVVVMSAMVG